MTAKEFAEMITGREAEEELLSRNEQQAKQNGLVVVSIYFDDCVEFRGAIDGDVGCYNGSEIHLTKKGILQLPECEEYDCPYFTAVKEKARLIKVVCHDEGDPRWTFETDIPHETFEVYEDGEVFCVGIVFSMNDLD